MMELLALGCVMAFVGVGLVAHAVYAKRCVEPALRWDVGVSRLAVGIVFVAVPVVLGLLVWAAEQLPNPFPGP